MFWTDEIIEDILKKIDKESYLITDWMTPSGHAHIGSLRGLIVHDLVRRGLEDKSKKAVFQFGFDDFDPMDGLPIYVDKSWQKYMGLPLNKVPAPDGKSTSFADQYLNEALEIFDGLGIKAKFVRDSVLHKEGKYDEAIKIVLDNASAIQKIYFEISGSKKDPDWFPLQVICPKCGKIGTTKVTGWDGKLVKFRCEEKLVEWAQGCGYEGEISPFGGNAKMPWKVAWGARWFVFNTDIEGEGKDHFAAGGSRDVANAIFREVFKQEPPYDIHYEFFLVGGKKMASSKGLGVTAKDMYDFLPANILRFLLIRTKAKRAIDFQPEEDAIPLLYDEYDRASVMFNEDPKSDLARAFYYTEIDMKKDPSTSLGAGQPKYLLRFSKIAYMLQMPRIDIFEYAEKEKASAFRHVAKSRGAEGDEGAIPLSDIEKQEIESRIEIAKLWLEKFAPENYKFNICDELPQGIELNSDQKTFLNKVLNLIKSKETWAGEDLHKEIHNIKNEMGIPPRDAFSAIYLIFIGKDSGPQAGWLLASLDKNFVIKRLEEVSNG